VIAPAALARRVTGQFLPGREGGAEPCFRPVRRLGRLRTLGPVRRAFGLLPMEPDAEGPPAQVWRDRLLFAGVTVTALAEAGARDDMVWRPFAVVLGLTLALTMLWRRTRPLDMVALGFGAFLAVDVASFLAVCEPFSLYAGAAVLVLVYSLFRWGTDRQAVLGSVIVLLEWFVSTTTDFTGVTDAVVGLVALMFPAALGLSIRYRRIVRSQQLDSVRLHEREMLARELHDTVAHHVSAIAIQAQAGQFLARSRDVGGAAKALEVIEGEASRTLVEMRSIVGSLRRDTDTRRCSPGAVLRISISWPPLGARMASGSTSSTSDTWTVCGPRFRPRCTGSRGSRSRTHSATRGTRPASRWW
jgi:Histidine kinase